MERRTANILNRIVGGIESIEIDDYGASIGMYQVPYRSNKRAKSRVRLREYEIKDFADFIQESYITRERFVYDDYCGVYITGHQFQILDYGHNVELEVDLMFDYGQINENINEIAEIKNEDHFENELFEMGEV